LKKGEFNYIRRNGRFTKAQKSAYENLYSKYRADPGRLSSLNRPFGLEIGFGMGEQFVQWACSVPDAWHLIGVELYKPGIGAMLSKADKLGLSNLSFIDQPIQVFLSDIASEGIDEVRIFFPDPWPKKKHAKRRLINTEFVDELSKKMAAGASLTIATDWEQYAMEITSIIDASSAFILKENAADRLSPEEKLGGVYSGQTKFEERGLRLGHTITRLAYTKTEKI
jgi:tRNA (guanine-N7-)-methyltransferase